MGSPRKNGRLGDPALPSLSSNSFHVKHFHHQFLGKPAIAAAQRIRRDFCGLGDCGFKNRGSVTCKVRVLFIGKLAKCESVAWTTLLRVFLMR
jgi:hypothetical protein